MSHSPIKAQHFTAELRELVEPVREKAVEIANEILSREADLPPRVAIQRAIPLAEQWYLDRAG
ncbi:hypothetical protein [Lewinella sp. JB7]|uniref:hypothetical protein n=1 Tax=Lewinella sp. JB7 TaxID=2962887 RepID=UPI0020C9DAB9|nr:hypothetical protein [Lewinella sp. JB7]MCP9236315.1 hypothetical protein [Lewinella sp. JB7]